MFSLLLKIMVYGSYAACSLAMLKGYLAMAADLRQAATGKQRQLAIYRLLVLTIFFLSFTLATALFHRFY